MKNFRNLSLIAFVLFATLAVAQTPNTPFKHVIIVVQENRTPDNLFGSDAFAASPQLPGADLVKYGNCEATCGCPGYQGIQNAVALQPFPIDSCFDPNHGHAELPHNNAWTLTYDNGSMDGACNVYIHWQSNGKGSGCASGKPSCVGANTCPYAYVVQNPPTTLAIQPYFDIAKNYGFANYMFQTNQGPSFLAHQFLLSGTSAPISYDQQYYDWFAAENQDPTTDNPNSLTGCVSPSDGVVQEVNNAGGGESPGYAPSGFSPGYPCYSHNTLPDLLEANGLTWRYYVEDRFHGGQRLWTAPNAISRLCGGPNPGQNCSGQEFLNNVSIPPNPAVLDAMAPVLEDIENCNLPNMSWVIPDGLWSDHAGDTGHFLGPAWVAAIVNAVGNSWTNSNQQCDYWGGYGTANHTEPTAILVTWDDWGGWYDHVLPYRCSPGPNGICQGYPNGNGSGNYVYGFRVPLLVVSAYNHRPAGSTGYISGACTAPGNCPNEKPPYVHDFGSILNFIEYAFGNSQQMFLKFPTQNCSGIGSCQYPYADWWAPDVFTSENCDKTTCPFGLADFFVTLSPPPQPSPFTQVGLPELLCNSQICYNAEYFENYGVKGEQPHDPDDDDIEQQN